MTLALKLGVLGLLALLLSSLLKTNRPEYVLPLQIAAVLLVLGSVLSVAGTPLDSFLRQMESLGLPMQLLGVLGKGAAVCLVTQLCAAFCKDNGSEALSLSLLLAGRAACLLLALPLLEQVLSVAGGFVS